MNIKTYSVKFDADLALDAGELLDDFSFPWLDRPCPRTEFQAVWNEAALRFRFDVDDDDVVAFEGVDQDESVLGSDRVELFFATDRNLDQTYFGAEMDPRGWVYDYSARYYRQFDPSWTFTGLECRGEKRGDGYSVEGTIELESLRSMNCLNGKAIIAGIYRGEFSHGVDGIVQDWISWVDPKTEKPDFHVPSSFGRFLLVD